METMPYFNLVEEGLEESGLQTGPISEGQTEYLVRELLANLGEDPNREGLQRTPKRVARMYDELLAGYRDDPVALVNGAVFESEYKNMVLVRDIEFYSLCEHHLLPFFGKAHVAYIPDGLIIGLSKIPRLVDLFSRRLQVQERMTGQIAGILNEIIQPKGVAVLVEGSHLCARMRGVKKPEANMVTSAFLGSFETDEKLRIEFLAQLPKGEK
jgi:GTP cyclohydrolase I